MANSFIKLSNTDFEQVRSSLIDYMRTKEEFTDYDFEGSALSTLIDLLAYNTAFFSTYTNFLANESFIDSAQKRDSLVSLARLVGYVPKSRIASRAVLNVTLNSGTTVPAGTVFSGSDTGYSFITIEDIELGTNTGDITVYQHSSSNPSINTSYINGKLTIPETADITSLKVMWNGEEYTRAERISVLNADSKVYFVDAIYSGAYEISFGDGVYGQSVPSDAAVTVSYITPNGIQNANGERTFTPASGSGVTINEVVSPSYGGSERESAESIRKNAPSYFQAQNRAVTAKDAEIVLKVDNPEVYDVTAWGGEDNNPPQYGRLFLSVVKDAAGTTFSATELSNLGARLQEKMVVGILPEFTDPTCYQINIEEDGTIVYDPTVNQTGIGLSDIVISAIQENDPNCGFKTVFPYSQIVANLVNNNLAIREVDFDITLSASFRWRAYAINSTLPRNFYISFANRIVPGTLRNNTFFYVSPSLGSDENLGFLDDDLNGNIRFGIYVNGIKKYLNWRQGTIDYDSGKITILNLNQWIPRPPGFSQSELEDFTVFAKPFSKSVRSQKQASYSLGTIGTFRVTQ